jgi:hypothetical protein
MSLRKGNNTIKNKQKKNDWADTVIVMYPRARTRRTEGEGYKSLTTNGRQCHSGSGTIQK